MRDVETQTPYLIFSLARHLEEISPICYYHLVMAKKGEKRKIIGLVCEACAQRHYYTTKNTMNTPDKVELVKYCPVKRVQAKQSETKKSLGRNEVKPRR